MAHFVERLLGGIAKYSTVVGLVSASVYSSVYTGMPGE